jgi:N-methylhydantoinase B
VADDVLDGVISPATALKDYGVVISAQGVVDPVATKMARSSRAA